MTAVATDLLNSPWPEWQRHAACRTADPDVFFPEGQGANATNARRICAGCPVQQECLDYAFELVEITGRHPTGVWGGLTERMRRALYRAPSRRVLAGQQ